ncbi:histidine kinase [uncultured Chitinophaga sp.]|jgi:Putative regulator of cell autolysis|uniref:sensor histidine kinase n=1 Tax=uncultured Chitinophaga sp. TaxID=339340 RepID=UPI00260A0006|nr:histidine kinase [uncultured Chitinophaga sp.]
MNIYRVITRYKLHHVLFWLAFFAVWLLLRIDAYPSVAATIRAGILKVVTLAGAVYFTNYVLIPRLLYRQRYAGFFLSFTALIIFTGWLVIQALNLVLRPYAASISQWPNSNLNSQLYDVYIPLFFMVGAIAGIQFYIDQLKTQHRLQSALRASAEQELQYLKAQINPHALFNSLNAVYFLIDKENKAAREMLMQFANLLRYQLYDSNTDTISIEKEAQYVANYVAIQQMRHNENCEVSFYCDPGMRQFQIAPLLLIPFVENAFKHVSAHVNAPNRVNISLRRQGSFLQLETYNTCEQMQRENGKHKGIGLANVKRRLELLYPERHHLQIDKTAQAFHVTLDIRIA